MNTKRVVKIAGNVLVVISILFIIKKFAELKVDFLPIISIVNIGYLLLISIAYSIVSVLQSYAWKKEVYLITKFNISWWEIIKTYVQSNLMKYIPGNVMHFVGRNEVAVRFELNHMDIAVSTIIDTVINLIASVIIVLLFYYQGLRNVLQKYQLNYKLLIAGVLLATAMIVTCLIIRNRFKSIDLMLRHVFSKQGLWINATNLLYYICLGILTSMLYIFILVKVVGQPFDFPIGFVLGAVSLSSTIGFITPGAPGGIGIREAVMSILLTGYLDVTNALLAIVLFRGISIVGDLFSFLTVKLIIKIKQRYIR